MANRLVVLLLVLHAELEKQPQLVIVEWGAWRPRPPAPQEAQHELRLLLLDLEVRQHHTERPLDAWQVPDDVSPAPPASFLVPLLHYQTDAGQFLAPFEHASMCVRDDPEEPHADVATMVWADPRPHTSLAIEQPSEIRAIRRGGAGVAACDVSSLRRPSP